MKKLLVKILGNGGCLNKGLPYNSFLINGRILVETPPDILLSLQKLDVDFSGIDSIYISHFHGDHTFGLPFFVINKWLISQAEGIDSSLSIIGPANIGHYAKKLTEAAFSVDHPCYNWLERNSRFIEIGDDFKTVIDDLEWSCFPVKHIENTYGFLLKAGDKSLFSYTADTCWCDQVDRILDEKPEVVLMDMNGGNPDIHISLAEVMEKGLPRTGDNTVYYGVHLAEEFDSPSNIIKCARPGQEIVISY